MKNPIDPKTVRAIPPARAMKKSVLFVDLPFLANGVRFNLYDLFRNLRNEFDEIRTYAYVPREAEEERDIWGFLRVATNAGAFPTLYPSDVDPFVTEDIRRALERRDVGEIAILSGDNGYCEVMRTAKRAGCKTKVILPPGSASVLLRSSADEVRTLNDYGKELFPASSDIRSDSCQIAAIEKESEPNVVTANARGPYQKTGHIRTEGGDGNE